MAQSIKNVNKSVLEILFKAGNYRYPNHNYNKSYSLNRSVCFSDHKITSELLKNDMKIFELNNVSYDVVSCDVKYHYFGLKSGLQKLYYDDLKEFGSIGKISLFDGMRKISDKWGEQTSDKILLFCSHIIVIVATFRQGKIYETVIISEISKELLVELAYRAKARAAE